jgi:hypothetical protein
VLDWIDVAAITAVILELLFSFDADHRAAVALSESTRLAL